MQYIKGYSSAWLRAYVLQLNAAVCQGLPKLTEAKKNEPFMPLTQLSDK